MNKAKIERNYLVAHLTLEITLYYVIMWCLVGHIHDADFTTTIFYLAVGLFVLAKSGLHFLQAIAKQKEMKCTSN